MSGRSRNNLKKRGSTWTYYVYVTGGDGKRRQISKGGMQVETTFPLQLDSLHDFRLTIRDRSIVVKGRVAHSRISEFFHDGVTYRSGIEFIEPSERVASVIAEFVEELRQERTPQ